MSEKQDALSTRSNATLRELAPVHDIPLQMGIEVGRMRLRVRDLMKLTVGAVISLKKPAGDPFDICINGVPVARGEVVAVDQLSGVRITEFLKSAGMSS